MTAASERRAILDWLRKERRTWNRLAAKTRAEGDYDEVYALGRAVQALRLAIRYVESRGKRGVK